MSIAHSTHMGPEGVGPIVLPAAELTTEQYLQMIAAGVLEGRKVELISGVITPLAPAGSEHGGSIIRFARLFAKSLDRFELGAQITLVVADGQVFDPDFMLLRLRPHGYRSALPRPEDVALLIESASSSPKSDRHVKLPIYAAAGIPEYWLADLTRKQLLVFRNPQGDRYLSETTLAGDQTVSPLACPDLVIRVGEIFQ